MTVTSKIPTTQCLNLKSERSVSNYRSDKIFEAGKGLFYGRVRSCLLLPEITSHVFGHIARCLPYTLCSPSCVGPDCFHCLLDLAVKVARAMYTHRTVTKITSRLYGIIDNIAIGLLLTILNILGFYSEFELSGTLLRLEVRTTLAQTQRRADEVWDVHMCSSV